MYLIDVDQRLIRFASHMRSRGLPMSRRGPMFEAVPSCPGNGTDLGVPGHCSHERDYSARGETLLQSVRIAEDIEVAGMIRSILIPSVLRKSLYESIAC